MAKNKKRKEEKKKTGGYSLELKGIGLVLLSIIGCCKFGLATKLIKGFSSFLVGSWWGLLVLLVGAIGIYIINKRESNFNYFPLI